MRQAILSVCCAVILNLALMQIALAEETTTQLTLTAINKAVSKCVDVVHSYQGDASTTYFFEKFDAYYNYVTGQVGNNSLYEGDKEPLFRFNKCMAQQGIPLGPPGPPMN